MTAHISRRQVIASAGATTAGLAGLRTGDHRAAAQEPISLRWATLTPGFTVMPVQYILANKLGEKHGLKLEEPINYTAVSTFYNDFVAGNFDVCLGTWDTFAARHQAGVPLLYLCSITTAEMIAVLAPKSGISDLSQIKGKVFAGMQATGTYRMTKALIREVYGFDIEKEATVQSVDNPAATVTLLMADRADAALSWEPNITAGLLRRPDLRVIFNAGEAYKKAAGRSLPFFGVAIRKELADKHPGIAGKLSAVFKECVAGINADQDKAIELFGAKTGIPLDVLREAMRSKRLAFEFQSMTEEEGRETVAKASEFLARNKVLPRAVDKSFFAA